MLMLLFFKSNITASKDLGFDWKQKFEFSIQCFMNPSKDQRLVRDRPYLNSVSQPKQNWTCLSLFNRHKLYFYDHHEIWLT